MRFGTATQRLVDEGHLSLCPAHDIVFGEFMPDEETLREMAGDSDGDPEEEFKRLTKAAHDAPTHCTCCHGDDD